MSTVEEEISMQPAKVSQDSPQPLHECVFQAIGNYFETLEGEPITGLYELVMREMELPLLKQVLLHTRNNQSRTAVMLGLSRGTLRKKLKIYGFVGS